MKKCRVKELAKEETKFLYKKELKVRRKEDEERKFSERKKSKVKNTSLYKKWKRGKKYIKKN